MWTNPPGSVLRAEVAPHAGFAVHQALASPRLEIVHTRVVALGDLAWRVEVGIANTGWLPTTVTHKARKDNLVRPIIAELSLPVGVTILGSANRQSCGQLDGRMSHRLNGGTYNDGTGDRVLVAWTVHGVAGTTIDVSVSHQRAGHASTVVTLG